MNVKMLKEQILNNSLSDDFLVLVCEDNFFIAEQYITKLCQIKHYTENFVNELVDQEKSALSLVFDFSNVLNILKTEVFSEFSSDYSQFKNNIVICNKVDKKVEDSLKNYIIKIPKLVDWQIKDYIKTICKDLEADEVDWLFDVTDGNIYRIENELDKIKLFSGIKQREILNELKYDDNSDLYKISVFTLCDALLKRNIVVLNDYLRHIDVANVDPFSLIGLLISNYKKILFINFNSGLSAEQLKMTPKQINAIKYYYRNISEKTVVNALKYLTSLDRQLKTGKLDLENNKIIELIICSLLNF